MCEKISLNFVPTTFLKILNSPHPAVNVPFPNSVQHLVGALMEVMNPMKSLVKRGDYLPLSLTSL